MKFKLYREFGALNSPPVFDALQMAIEQLGYQIVNNNEDVSVIWSVLWHGRMANNRQIYEKNQREKRKGITTKRRKQLMQIMHKLRKDLLEDLEKFSNGLDIGRLGIS